MQYRRTILKHIDSQINTKEIIVITGMRRVGKTTLLRMIYDLIPGKNKVFLDLENILEQKIFEETDFNNILNNLKPYGINQNEKSYIFLDEIQVKPEIVNALKYLYDHHNIKFFVTGSSSFYLKNLFPESLAGRKVIFELFPLDFDEFLTFKNVEHETSIESDFMQKEQNKNFIKCEKLKKFYDEYLTYGGFPQVALADNNEQKKIYLNDIFNSYFEKEVRALADFKKITVFRDMLILLMQRTGSKLDFTKLSSELGVTRETIYSYIAFLEGTYFIFLLSPFSNNADKEVSGAKKVYLCDTGFLTHLAKIPEGSLLENSVFLNLRKYGKLNYYQRRSGPEIDFILPEKKIALEVKSKASARDYFNLAKTAGSIGIKEFYVTSGMFSYETGIIPAMDL
ncbi:MAG: ATP-binding protein [Bacteroidetes bacterium]|nr:ATP-binding protein [Bacteroidota bacterium]